MLNAPYYDRSCSAMCLPRRYGSHISCSQGSTIQKREVERVQKDGQSHEIGFVVYDICWILFHVSVLACCGMFWHNMASATPNPCVTGVTRYGLFFWEKTCKKTTRNLMRYDFLTPKSRKQTNLDDIGVAKCKVCFVSPVSSAPSTPP